MPDSRPTFHQQLDAVKTDVARLAAMVTDVIPRGTHVLLNGDLEAAKALIEHDDELDRLTLEIEEQCYALLVLQQPMAIDLRVIVSALRMASEIERSGDLVVNIAKTMRRIYGDELTPRIRGLIEQMSEEAAKLYKSAIDAYLDEDDALAAAIDDMDDVLDSLQKDFIEAVIAAHEAERIDLNAAVQLALIARYYERIGDHAVNMGERVQYLVTGWLPEHGAAAVADAREKHRPGPVEAEVVGRAEEGYEALMRILITNDDGHQSRGIGVLAAAVAAAGHDVVVVAPDRDQSGCGAGIGQWHMDEHIDVQDVELEDAPEVRAIAVRGTPALAVFAANLGAFGDPPDLVVSGINPGLNTGRATLHSGTVGAALTAANLGLSGLAVSQDYGDPMVWTTAADLAVEAIGWIDGAPDRTVLNLNVPNAEPAAVKGIRWAALAPFGSFRAALADRTDGRLQMEFREVDDELPADSDTALVFAGYAAVSSLVGIRVGPPLAEADGVDPPVRRSA